MSSPASSLPDSWVQKIWATMRGTYGAAFDRMWATPQGADPAQHAQTLMAHWAKELGRYTSNPQAITYALEHLPANPPNLIEFKESCNRAPARITLAIEAPKANPNVIEAAIARAREAMRFKGDRLDPIRRLRQRELNGGTTLTRAQREFWRIALKKELGQQP